MSYSLEIYTPQRTVYSGMVDSLVAQGLGGSFGVLSRHAPMLAALAFSVLKVKEQGGKTLLFAISDGYFEVVKNKAVVLVDTAERSNEIDLPRANHAKERAEKRLREGRDNVDVVRAQAALRRALARIKAANHGK